MPTISPHTVTISFTCMPAAATLMMFWSADIVVMPWNMSTMPTTVPSDPSIGATLATVERIGRFFSSAAERMFGMSEQEAIGQNISMLMPRPDAARHDNYIGRYRSTGERHIIGIGRIVTGQRKDGSTFPIHLSIGEMESGGERYFTGFIRDLTEYQQTQARLHELQAELVHVSRLTAMGEMASALAHELNQPLSAISNYMKGSRRLLIGSADPTAPAVSVCAPLAVPRVQTVIARPFLSVATLAGFAVPAEDGTFELPAIPAGTHQITAWHERLGDTTLDVRVDAGRTASTDFVLPVPPK